MDTPSKTQPRFPEPERSATPARPFANPPGNAIDGSPEMFGRVVRALDVAYWEWIPGTSAVHVSTRLGGGDGL